MGVFDGIAKGLGDAVDWVGHAAVDVGEAVGVAVATGTKVSGTLVSVAGAPLRFVYDGVLYAVGEITGVHLRRLTNPEQNLIRMVFLDTVPVDRVLISSVGGLGDRPFTLPGSFAITASNLIPGFGQALALAGMVEHLHDKFIINVAKRNYNYMGTSADDVRHGAKGGSLLVHEATHVWQGLYRAFDWWYLFNSVRHQAESGQGAYDVPGVVLSGKILPSQLRPWDQYNAEQQAHIVEYWYRREKLQNFYLGGNDQLYPFIRDNIRARDPHARARFDSDRAVLFTAPDPTIPRTVSQTPGAAAINRYR